MGLTHCEISQGRKMDGEMLGSLVESETIDILFKD